MAKSTKCSRRHTLDVLYLRPSVDTLLRRSGRMLLGAAASYGDNRRKATMKRKRWCVWVRERDYDDGWGEWEWKATFLYREDASDYADGYLQWAYYKVRVLPEGRKPAGRR